MNQVMVDLGLSIDFKIVWRKQYVWNNLMRLFMNIITYRE